MSAYKDVKAMKTYAQANAFHPGRMCRTAALAAGLWIAVACPIMGQQAAKPADKLPGMTTKIQEVRQDVKHLELYVNRSAMVESNVPVERVQSFAPQIAVVESISPNQVLITGKAIGNTQVLLVAPDGQQELIEVAVSVESKLLQSAIAKIAPRAQVEAHTLGNAVILTGSVGDPDTADRIMEVASMIAGEAKNYMRVAGEQQIMLRTTVAEVSKAALRQLGVNGFFGGDDFRDFFLVNQIDQINPINIGAGPDQNMVGQLRFFTGEDGIPISNTTNLSLGFPRVEMQLFMLALRENSLLRVLAEPNLVATSGQTASFLAGGEFPVPVPQSSQGGGTTITIEYREFGVRLSFTPTFLGGQMVRLHIAPEVSELDYTSQVSIAGTIVPGLRQRRAETTVEIGNGQTLAIAGLLSEESRGVARRIPSLGDVPVLGALFSSNQFQKRITDLMILVTPEIVSPMNPDQVPPVPGEYMTDPNDWQLFALGLIEGESAGHPQDPVRALKTETPVRTTPAMLMNQADPLSLRGPWGPADHEEAR